MAPAISIIVPVYNVEKYIRRCIDSILAQTFTDFELILVDDGSPDHSGAICDEYAEKDSRIRVIHKENGGVSSARNAALDIAKGQYIMFCDSDDYVDCQWCQQMYAVVSQHPNAWVCCNVWIVESAGNIRLALPAEAESAEIQRKSFYALYAAALDGSLCNKIFSGAVIHAHKLSFNSLYKIGEDTDFCVRYYQYCDSILLISKPLYYYFQNTESAVHIYRPDSFELYRHCFFDRLPYIEPEHLGRYLDNWLWRFTNMLDNTLDSRNPMRLWQKLCYNQKMMQTEEFIYCVAHAPGEKESPLFMKVVRTHNYYLFWLFQQFCRIKAKLQTR